MKKLLVNSGLRPICLGLGLVISFLVLYPKQVSSQVQLGIGVPEFIFNANNSAAPQVGTVYSIPPNVTQFTWNISFASAPASQSTILEFSNDNSTWVTADTSTSTAGESRNVFNASRFVRATESARSGGGAITVTITGKSGFVTAFQPGSFNLFSDAANTINIRNATNPQIVRIYRTFTDASNFQSLDFDTSTPNIANIKNNWAGTGTAWDIQFNNSFAISGSTGLVNKVSNVVTVGQGVEAIRANGRVTAQVAANASISTYTVGAADGSFEVSANVLVTTATTHNFTVECAYTDEGNTARVATFLFELIAGTTTTSVINTNGAVPYEGIPLHIRAKAATAITIRTQAAGTYTTVVYNAEGIIRHLS